MSLWRASAAALLLWALVAGCGPGLMAGRFYYQDGEYGRARQELERAAATHPDNPEVQLWLGKTCAELGDYAAMSAAFDRCLARSHEHADEIQRLRHRLWEGQQELGSHLLSLRPPDLHGALAALRSAADILADNPETLRGLAFVYTRLDSSAAALAAHERLVGLDPTDREVLRALGDLYMDAGRHADAARTYERQLELDPYDEGLMLNLGAAYVELERLADASDIYRRVVELNPQNPSPHVGLGLVCERQGQYAAAAAAYAAALALRPDETVLYDLARVHVKRGDDEAALPLLEVLSVRAPERRVWEELARIYGELGLDEQGRLARQRAEAAPGAAPAR